MWRPSVVFPAASAALALLAGTRAWPAPCCSAGSALPALVTNDDQAQVSVMTSLSDTVMDAPDRGVPRLRSERSADESWLTRVSGALKVGDAWQAGVGTSFIRRSAKAANRDYRESGFGDSDVSIAYEALPEWSYSEWKPRGWLYLQAVLPTGQAIQDPRLESPASVRGQGVFQTALGLALTKSWGNWDAFAVPEIRRLYGRGFGESGTRLSGAWGVGIQLGAGYSPSDWRFGLRTQPVYQGEREITVAQDRTLAPAKQVWNTGVDVSYRVNSQWMIAASYSDQTLLGSARNTTLERGLGVMLSRKWEP